MHVWSLGFTLMYNKKSLGNIKLSAFLTYDNLVTFWWNMIEDYRKPPGDFLLLFPLRSGQMRRSKFIVHRPHKSN